MKINGWTVPAWMEALTLSERASVLVGQDDRCPQWLIDGFKKGEAPCDEPPGLEERAYLLWLFCGGKPDVKKKPAGDYSIGSGKWAGLSKLIEEMGEAGQVAGKLIATNGETAHWDGSDLRTRLTEELADLAAAITFFTQTNGLDTEAFHARRVEKVRTFNTWHNEQGK